MVRRDPRIARACLAALVAWPAPAATEPDAPAADAGLMPGMNPFLLTNLVASEVRVEVDWVAGATPSALGLETFRDVLQRHAAPGKRIDLRLDDEIPETLWQSCLDPDGPRRIAERFLDADPAAWEQYETVYVLYAPDSGSWYDGRDVSGMTTTLAVRRGERAHHVQTVVVFAESIRRDSLLWITGPRIERAIVAHELGHVLGLVSNPLHTQREHPGHCTRSACAMNQPGLRSRLHNAFPALLAGRVPHRYCERCRADLQRSGALWADAVAREPALLDRLRARRAAGEASSVELPGGLAVPRLTSGLRAWGGVAAARAPACSASSGPR
jgi:hypothetical protein